MDRSFKKMMEWKSIMIKDDKIIDAANLWKNISKLIECCNLYVTLIVYNREWRNT